MILWYDLHILIPHLLFYRKPGSPPSWKQLGTALMTLSISLQQRAPIVTSCCPTWAAQFAEPPWATFWGTSWGSSMPCGAAVQQTLAVACPARARPLSRHQKKSTTHPYLPQPVPREAQTPSISPQDCLFQLLHALDPQIWAPGNVKNFIIVAYKQRESSKADGKLNLIFLTVINLRQWIKTSSKILLTILDNCAALDCKDIRFPGNLKTGFKKKTKYNI